MAPHDHLLNNFAASKETRSLGGSLLHQINLKTGHGSGHELGTLKVALPAVCMLLASERLNNTDVSRSSSQVASCVKKKDYEKLYTLAKALLEETEEDKLSYSQLHINHKSSQFEERMLPYIKRAENELMVGTGLDHKEDIFKATVYFWVCSSACLKTLPTTEDFSREYHLQMKKFTQAVEYLNNQCRSLRASIQADFNAAQLSPTKPVNTSTPRQSPRKANNVASSSRTTTEESEPVRRSLRNVVAQDLTPRTSPIKRTPQTSPTKIAQPNPFRFPPANRRLRELPTRDSPKKRVAQVDPEEKEDVGSKGDAMDTGTDLDLTYMETPTKRRKLVEPPVEKSRPSIAEPVVLPPPKANPRNLRQRTEGKALQAMHADSSSDESEPELNLSIRRYRPVYLDHKQWNARDPRLDKIWRKAEKKRKAHAGSAVTVPFADEDVSMDD